MTVELRAGDLVAAFEPDASMVCSSLRDRGDELLGQRGGLVAWIRDGKTFGIPLLHPWANRLGAWSYDDVTLPQGTPLVRPEEHGLPIHGLLHGSTRWEVLSADAARVVARYDFGADRERLPLFPYPHVIEVEAALDGGGLTHVTRVRATGDAPVPIAFGWHPYLVLPGVGRADWRIETSVRERLELDDRSIPTGVSAETPVPSGPLGKATYDDAFASADRASFTLSGGGRRLEIRFLDGYTYAQLFAPPTEDLIAFEPMTAPADALRSGRGLRTLAPGASSEASFRLGVGADRE